ncbi:MAG: hypothetical protein KAJ19_05315 [Gammaproteobacteria bacterium]|nr:hypothetical protein [Gammaproteobacteria bacterium]
MRYHIPEELSKKARAGHDLFLINLITNHVLLTVILLGLIQMQPLLLLIIPVISFCILGYSLLRAKKSLRVDPWYAQCHWQICAKRSKVFIAILGVWLVFMIVAYLVYLNAYVGAEEQLLNQALSTFQQMEIEGQLRSTKTLLIALMAVGGLPTMVSVFALIVMEQDALHLAKTGGPLPEWVLKKLPFDGSVETIEDEIETETKTEVNP